MIAETAAIGPSPPGSGRGRPTRRSSGERPRRSSRANTTSDASGRPRRPGTRLPSAPSPCDSNETTLRGAQRPLHFEEIEREGLVAAALHLLGHPTDPFHEIVEAGRRAGESGTVVVHAPSLPDRPTGSDSRRRERLRKISPTSDGGFLQCDRSGAARGQKDADAPEGVGGATLGGGSQMLSPYQVAGTW